MKELLRRLIFPFMPDQMYAQSGSIKYRILNWLYGENLDAASGPHQEGIDIRP